MMNNKTLKIAIILLIILSLVFLCALMVGHYLISAVEFLKIIFKNDNSLQVQKSIILGLRLPRTIAAGLVGVGLSLSGLVYQETFRNKLVSPDFLGVSSGASVGAALAIILGLSIGLLSLLAFVFGISAMLLTMFFAGLLKKQSPTILVLSGIIVSSLMSAALSIIKYSAPSEIILADITFWLLGSFASIKFAQIWIILPVVTICTLFLYLLRFRINVVGQGPVEAQTQGLHYKAYRNTIIIIATFMTATCVAFSGIIGWIGLVVPHVVRLFVGKNTKNTIPLVVLFGAIFMILADVLSRTFTSSEIPISAITGLLGTIIFGFSLYVKRGVVNEIA